MYLEKRKPWAGLRQVFAECICTLLRAPASEKHQDRLKETL